MKVRKMFGESVGLLVFALAVVFVGVAEAGFVDNDAVNKFDPLGLTAYVVSPSYKNLPNATDASADVKRWNQELDAEKKKMLAAIQKRQGFDVLAFYWWEYDAAKKKPLWKKVSKNEFTKRLETEKIIRVVSPAKNVASEIKAAQDTVKKHKNSWDSTGYWHHTYGDNTVPFIKVNRDKFAKQITGAVKPAVGDFVYASCIGAGKPGQWTQYGRLVKVNGVGGPQDQPRKSGKKVCYFFWKPVVLESEYEAGNVPQATDPE